MTNKLPASAVGLRLARIATKGDLILCEAMKFDGGRAAVDTVLRRAAVSGQVIVGGEISNHFADVLDTDGTIVETVSLDAASYRALKNRWMKCKVERFGLDRRTTP